MTSDCDDWIDETRSIVSDEDFIAGVATPDSDPGRTPRASDSDDDSEDFIKADQPCMGAPAHPHSDADVVDDTLPALGVETEAEDDVPVVMKRPACKSKSIDALIEFMHDIRGPKCERLLNNKTLARKVGLAPSHLNDHIMAIANTSLSSSLSSYATTMKDIMEQCRFVAGRGFQLQPLVFARQRRYDGTQMKVKTQVASIPFDMGNAGVLMQPTQSIVCNPHVITTTLKFGVALGRLTGDERDIILLVGRLPAKLGLVDTCTGETLYEFLRRLEYTFDDSIDKRFSHILDLMTLDDAASNWRGERRYKVDHPGPVETPRVARRIRKRRAYLRAVPQSSTVAAADVAPLAIGDGAPPALAIHDLQAPSAQHMAEMVLNPRPKGLGPKPEAQGPRLKIQGLNAQGSKPKAQNQRQWGPKPKAQNARARVRTPRPKAQCPTPKVRSPRPKAQGPRPKAQGSRPKAQGPRPKAPNTEPNAQGLRSNTPGAKSKAQCLRPKPRGPRLRAQSFKFKKSLPAGYTTVSLGFWVFGFWPWALRLGFRVAGLGPRALGLRPRADGLLHWIDGEPIGCWINLLASCCGVGLGPDLAFVWVWFGRWFGCFGIWRKSPCDGPALGSSSAGVSK